jgi:cytoskeletal protein CcmA (bactofilin family)
MAAESMIGAGTLVRGNVRGEGSLEVLGKVEGDVVMTGDVTLGEAAVVKGRVSGANLSIAGTVQGDLTGSESVVVETGARVVGDLVAPRLGIAAGALVRGMVRTDGEPALATPVRRGIGAQPLRVAPSAARPAAVRPAPAPAVRPAPAPAPKPAADDDDSEAPPAREAEERHAPAPMVPVLSKGIKGKKKAKK